MTLNQREKPIAWILGAALGLIVVYWGGTKWWDARAKMDQQILLNQNKLKENKALLDKALRVEGELASWRIQRIDMSRPDPAQTDILVRTTYASAGLPLTGWTGQGLRASSGSRDFQESKYTVSITTTTARLARFLQTIENAPIPARIDQITITTPKPGVDNLRVDINISALLYAPKTVTALQGAARPATVAAATRGPETGRTPTTRGTGRTTTGRSTTTRAATTTKPTLTTQERDRLEQQMIERKKAEEARLAAEEARLATLPKRTPEEIEAEMKAKRLREEGGMPESQPAPSTAPATVPTIIGDELKEKPIGEAAAAGSQPATETGPATTGGTQ